MKKIEVFQKLLDSVKANCPGLISEEVYNQFNQQYDQAISQIEATASQEGYERGQQDGFKDGYAEAKRIADENLKAETDKIVAQCDEEAVAKITEILQAIDEQNTEKLQVVYDMVKEYKAELEAMDADHAEKLNQVQDFYLDKLAQEDAANARMLKQYAEAVDKKHAKQLKVLFEAVSADHAKKLNECVDFIDRKHAKQLKTIMEAVDKDHAKKLNQIVESINEDHAKKLEVLMESIDKDHSKKLMEAVKHEHSKKVNVLAEGVEKYLNYALEEKLPKKQLVSEQKYNVALKTIDKITDYLKVNGIIQESKDGIFNDYEQQITTAKEKTSKLISENAKLTRKLQRKEAQIVLEEKLKNVTPAQAEYLRKRFRFANSPKVIQESIEDARKSFRKEQAEKRAKVQAKYRKENGNATQPSSVVLENKEEPKTQAAAQTKETKQGNTIAEFYANYLKRKN